MPAFMIGLGLAWFFSALGVTRDIGQLGSFLGLAILYSSVFYSAEKAPRLANFAVESITADN